MAIPEPVAGTYNEAAMMAACEKVEVAEGSRVNGFPVLLPEEGVELSWREMNPTEWPAQNLGNVKVQKMFDFTMQTLVVPTVGAFGLSFFVVDGGQNVEDQLRKCDTIAMHMAYRVPQTLVHTDKALEESARTWFKHYGNDLESQRPSW